MPLALLVGRDRHVPADRHRRPVGDRALSDRPGAGADRVRGGDVRRLLDAAPRHARAAIVGARRARARALRRAVHGHARQRRPLPQRAAVPRRRARGARRRAAHARRARRAALRAADGAQPQARARLALAHRAAVREGPRARREGRRRRPGTRRAHLRPQPLRDLQERVHERRRPGGDPGPAGGRASWPPTTRTTRPMSAAETDRRAPALAAGPSRAGDGPAAAGREGVRARAARAAGRRAGAAARRLPRAACRSSTTPTRTRTSCRARSGCSGTA